MIRVAVVEDFDLLREDLRELIAGQEDMEVAWEAGNGQDAVERAAKQDADIVLMDDDPSKIALAMQISRKTLRIVHQNIVFALAVKLACLLLGAVGLVGMWWAIFADVGVMILAVLNATRALSVKRM